MTSEKPAIRRCFNCREFRRPNVCLAFETLTDPDNPDCGLWHLNTVIWSDHFEPDGTVRRDPVIFGD